MTQERQAMTAPSEPDPMRVRVAGVWSTGRLGFHDTWYCMMETLPALGIPVVRGTGVFWGQGMERAMTMAIEKLDPEWLLCLDHDGIFELADIEELLRLAFAHPEADLICPVQWHRGEDRPMWAPVEGADPSPADLDTELYPIRSGHLGLTLLRAASVRAMPHPWFHEIPDGDGRWGPNRIDSDTFFWRRLRAHGSRLFLAPRVEIGHMELGIRWPGENGGTFWQTFQQWLAGRRAGRVRRSVEVRRAQAVARGGAGADLAGYARNVHSQCGEDGILARLIELLPGIPHHCVEFGAADGHTHSNTAVLLEQGWQGVMLEGDAKKAKEAAAYWGTRADVTVHSRIVGWGRRDSLDFLLENWTATPKEFGVLSIDVDGNDWHIWSAVRRHRAWIVVVEFNPTFPPWVSWTQPRDAAVNQGASLLALVELGRVLGYRLAAATDWNAIFVAVERADAIGIADAAPEALWWRPEYWTWEAYGYDSEAIRGGLRRPLWTLKDGRYAGTLPGPAPAETAEAEQEPQG